MPSDNKIASISRDTGVGILVIEHKVGQILEAGHKVYSMKLGRVVFAGAPETLKHDRAKLGELFM